MNAEPPTARFQMEHQPRRPGYATRSVARYANHQPHMTLFEVSSIGSLLGAPMAGAIVGLRSSFAGTGIGLAIGLAISVAFHFGVCKFLQVVVRKAETFRKNREAEVRTTRPSTNVLNSITNVLGESILYGLLLSPLLSIPLTVFLVRIVAVP